MTDARTTVPSAPSGSAECLAAREVYKAYLRGREVVHALRGASLVVHPGEMVALLGRSGSGKTTLLNCLLGWETPDSGEVSRPGPAAHGTGWRATAVVPQRFGLLQELSLADNVALPARLAGMDDPWAAAVSALEALGMAHLAHRSPADTSLGEQQRTTIARALVVDPAFVVADEPTGCLDEELSATVLATLRESCVRTGMGVLIASHDPLVRAHVDRVVRIDSGQFRADGGQEP